MVLYHILQKEENLAVFLNSDILYEPRGETAIGYITVFRAGYLGKIVGKCAFDPMVIGFDSPTYGSHISYVPYNTMLDEYGLDIRVWVDNADRTGKESWKADAIVVEDGTFRTPWWFCHYIGRFSELPRDGSGITGTRPGALWR